MKSLLLMLMFSCVCAFADASVLGIFEDTSFPAEAVGKQDGGHRLEGVFRYSLNNNSGIRSIKTDNMQGGKKIIAN